MIFMGFGAASVFTTTSIASQNAVPVRRPRRGHGDRACSSARSAARSAWPCSARSSTSTIRTEIPAAIGVPARRGGRADPLARGDRRPAPRRPPGRRRQRRARRQPDLPDLRRRDGLRHPHRHPPARAPAADARRAVRRDGGRGDRGRGPTERRRRSVRPPGTNTGTGSPPPSSTNCTCIGMPSRRSAGIHAGDRRVHPRTLGELDDPDDLAVAGASARPGWWRSRRRRPT